MSALIKKLIAHKVFLNYNLIYYFIIEFSTDIYVSHKKVILLLLFLKDKLFRLWK